MDDTDLLHIELTKNEMVNKVHMAIQESVNNWENLLIATGEALQPSKSFYSIISFDWINGACKYASNAQKGEFGVTVPLPGGGKAGLLCQENSGCDDFPGREQPGFNSDDARKGTAVGKRLV